MRLPAPTVSPPAGGPPRYRWHSRSARTATGLARAPPLAPRMARVLVHRRQSLAQRNSRSAVVTMFPIPGTACVSSRGTALIRVAAFGMRPGRGTAPVPRAAMRFRSRWQGRRVAEGASGIEHHVGVSCFSRQVFRTCRSHRHVTPACRCRESISTCPAVAGRWPLVRTAVNQAARALAEAEGLQQ